MEQSFSYRHLWATENITEESPPRSGNPGYQGKGTPALDFAGRSVLTLFLHTLTGMLDSKPGLLDPLQFVHIFLLVVVVPIN